MTFIQGRRTSLRSVLAPGFHISRRSALVVLTAFIRGRRTFGAVRACPWLPYFRAFSARRPDGFHQGATHFRCGPSANGAKYESQGQARSASPLD